MFGTIYSGPFARKEHGPTVPEAHTAVNPFKSTY